MGLEKNKSHEENSKKTKRGSVNNKKRLEDFGNASSAGGADWGGCDPVLLQSVVVSITQLGGAIILGLSRDMGAHSMTLLLKGERKALYFNGDADLDEELQTIFEKFESMT